jgi:hypothetical protein
MPFVSLTRAIFRSAELGFLGVVVPTLMQTPLLNGFTTFLGLFLSVSKVIISAGDFVFFLVDFLLLFVS